MARNMVLTTIALMLFAGFVWLFVTMTGFFMVREDYQEIGNQLVNLSTGDSTTIGSLLIVSAGAAVLISAVVMVPIAAVVYGVVASNSRKPNL